MGERDRRRRSGDRDRDRRRGSSQTGRDGRGRDGGRRDEGRSPRDGGDRDRGGGGGGGDHRRHVRGHGEDRRRDEGHGRWGDGDRGYRRDGGGGRESDRRRGGGGRGGRDSSRSPSERRRSRSSSRDSVDDEGHISRDITSITVAGERRFEVDRELDRGTFGAVFEAYDTKHREKVAVKVIRRVKRYVEDALVEVGILDDLLRNEGGSKYCVRLYKHFHYREHLCIVTELLGQSLYHAMKRIPARRDGFHGVSLGTLQHIARQLCEAMAFLAKAGLVHADLKTENVLLLPGESLQHDRPAVKLIDFGAATWDKDTHGTIIQTRQYRAPEVVLGLDWSFPCDIWSVACIVLELHEGRLTFETHHTAQHLAMMERLCGPIPRTMAQRARHGTEGLFDKHSATLRWPGCLEGEVSRAKGKELEEGAAAVEPVLQRHSLASSRHRELAQLLARIFVLDPGRRAKPCEALEEPFLTHPPPRE